MRWEAKTLPKHGDYRTRRVFAWTPTKVNDYIVWLEFYFIREKYKGPYWEEQGRYF